MQIALYIRNGSDLETLSIVFNSTNSDDKNWFSKSRVVHSPWKDLKNETPNVFSIEGCCNGRDFYISKSHGGCSNDGGWLAIISSDCEWEKRVPAFTALYSNRMNYTNWNHYGKIREQAIVFFSRVLQNHCCKLIKNLAVWLVRKTRATISTIQIQIKNQP